MFEVWNRTPNYEPFAYYAVDEKMQIQAMLSGVIQTVKPGLFSCFSKRAVMLQAPIYSEVDALDFLISNYTSLMQQKVIYTEVRNHYSDDSYNVIMSNMEFKIIPHFNFIVDCNNPNETWIKISESKRRQIKKAEKKGVTIEENPNMSHIMEFYKILDDLYHNKVKKPLVPFEYFQALYKICVPKNNARFLLVVKESKVIGGIVCPISGNKCIHENYIAGLDEEYKDSYPSVIATWSAIDYACKNGIKEFDFMGAGSPDEDYGVRDFKAKFGGRLVEPGRFISTHSILKYWIANNGFKLYQKLKYK
jgi:lipid II:glycine glycyltransferase (peptidoglycan interpeptide bridge formation enzyme)